jgi:hypothetical protein
MPARKPGGKYKGKIARAKGEATIAAELEAKRRRAYEENLRRLQDRRAADQLAKQGLQSAEDEAMELKLQKIAMMFGGGGKKNTYKKFFKNWQVGLIQIKKEKLLNERQNCWKRSCAYCTEDGKPGKFGGVHVADCNCWWKSALGREQWGEELFPHLAKLDRPPLVNANRLCNCCSADTGVPGLGCRAWAQLRDPEFEKPSLADEYLQQTRQAQMEFALAGQRSASSPDLASSPKHHARMTSSAMDNLARLRGSAAPEYDPTEPFALSSDQAALEERRTWTDSLNAVAGVPVWRRGGQGRGDFGTVLPPISLGTTSVPSLTTKGKPLDQATHWRSGMTTMMDTHMMKMYVVGRTESGV